MTTPTATPAAMLGVQSKEFGGSGHHRLVFDDSDGQLRLRLATTHAATQLNLGHLIHQAGNCASTENASNCAPTAWASSAASAARGWARMAHPATRPRHFENHHHLLHVRGYAPDLVKADE